MAPLAPLALLFFPVLSAVFVHGYDVRRVAPVTRSVIKTEILSAAQFFLPLTDTVSRSTYKKKLLALRNQRSTSSLHSPGDQVLAGSADDQEYVTDITIGGQDFKVVVDTGS